MDSQTTNSTDSKWFGKNDRKTKRSANASKTESWFSLQNKKEDNKTDQAASEYAQTEFQNQPNRETYEDKPQGVFEVDTFHGLAGDAPLALRSLMLRKSRLLRYRARCQEFLNEATPQNVIFLPGMQPAQHPKSNENDAPANSPDWLLKYFGESYFTDFDAEFNRMKRPDTFGARRIFLDGFDKWALFKYHAHREVKALTSVILFFQSVFLLFFIAVFLGTNFTRLKLRDDVPNAIDTEQTLDIGIFYYQIYKSSLPQGDLLSQANAAKYSMMDKTTLLEKVKRYKKVHHFIENAPVVATLTMVSLTASTGLVILIVLSTVLIIGKQGLRITLILFVGSLIEFLMSSMTYILLLKSLVECAFIEKELGFNYSLFWFMNSIAAILTVLNMVNVLLVPTDIDEDETC